MQSIRVGLYKFYERLQKFIAPSLRFSQEIYEEALREYVPQNGAWLDVGCGHRLLPPWRAKQEQEFLLGKCVFGIDYDLEALRQHPNISSKARADVAALPFRDESFDLVTANMVVEHLKTPGVQFKEIYRVLRPGGRFLFHTPSTYGYTTAIARLIPEFAKKKIVWLVEGRKEEDVFPTYYRANNRTRITGLANASGFQTERLRLIASTASLVNVPPLVIFELLWLRFLLTPLGRSLRTNIIAVLRKPER